METYKNIFIGFGKAAKTLANQLAANGEEVLMIEASDQMYGGTCINIACLPSKNLKHLAEANVPFSEAIDQKNTLIGKLRDKNYHKLADKDMATVWTGEARFTADHELEVKMADGDVRKVTGERIFINTGAFSWRLSIPGADLEGVLNSTELMALTEQPEHLVIIGSGYIGTEFAATFTRFGSKVTILEFGEDFLPREEPEISKVILEDLQSDGVTVHFGAETQAIEKTADGLVVKVQIDGKEEQIPADNVLMATGRAPRTTELGLENTQIQLGERGEIKVNEKLETSVANVWAMGDVKGGPQFTYVSLDDSRIVASQLLPNQEEWTTTNRPVIPHSLFVHPALGQVGLTEKEAKAKGYDYKVYQLASSGIPKANVLGNPRGMYKIIVDQKTAEIIGASIYAEESHEVINIIVLAMNAHLPYTLLRDQIYTHPTMAEALNDVLK